MESISTSSKGLRPILTIFQILALYPLPNHILNTLYAFASISVGAWMIISLLVISPLHVNGSMRVFMSYVVFIIRAILPMLIIAQAFFTRLEQTKIFKILSEIDKTFARNFAKNINYKRLRTKYLVSFFAPLLCLAVIRVYFVYHLIIYHSDAKFRFYWFHQVQSLIVSRVRCVQVAFYANLINDRIQWIHFELVQIIAQRRNVSQQKLQAKIIFLRQIYRMIYDVSALTNKSFGWSLLVITISYFVDSVGNCFKYLLVLEKTLPMSDEISSSVGLISTSITLITLCYSCGRCADNNPS
ncbi:hypothetical protein HA402_009910 [Bradysia odoriphaga]|nr:hypothetical protein HA402_009910 [Bradysia odoriphaga]